MEVNMEGYPKGLEAWLEKQGDWFTILYSRHRVMQFIKGPAPYFLFENMAKYLASAPNGHWRVEIDKEKIRKDFCTPMEDISIFEFIKAKFRKLCNDIKYRLRPDLLADDGDPGNLIDVADFEDEDDD